MNVDTKTDHLVYRYTCGLFELYRFSRGTKRLVRFIEVFELSIVYCRYACNLEIDVETIKCYIANC